MILTQQNILRVVDEHARKASESQYDRAVAIAAIAAVRKLILAIPEQAKAEAYRMEVLAKLDQLKKGYHDSDGQFTSGKGVIGAVIDDLRSQPDVTTD